MLVALHPLPTHPKGERPKPSGFGKVFRDPGTMGLQCLRKVLDERLKESFTGLS